MTDVLTLRRLSDVGEKSLIRDFIKPYFNAADNPADVGDDCAMVLENGLDRPLAFRGWNYFSQSVP